MLTYVDNQEAIDAAYGLLAACVKYHELSSDTRSKFCGTLAEDSNPKTVGHRLQILVDLTKHGKNLTGLLLRVVPVLSCLLQQTFDAAHVVRRKRRGSRSPEVELRLEETFDCMHNLIKYNSKILRHHDLEDLVTRILYICQKTTSRPDLQHCVEWLRALVVYADLPSASLQGCIEVFAGVLCQVTTLRDALWKTLRSLLQSHLGNATIGALMAILSDPKIVGKNTNIIRGSVQFLQRIVTEQMIDFAEHEDAGTLEPIARNAYIIGQPEKSVLLAALRNALECRSVRLEADVLALLHTLLQIPGVADEIFADDCWVNLKAIVTSVSRNDPGQPPRSVSTQSFPELRRFDSQTSDNDTDSQNTAIVPVNVQALATRLFSLCEITIANKNGGGADQTKRDRSEVERKNFTDMERKRAVAELFLDIMTQLEDGTAIAVLELYSEQGLTTLPNENWRENCKRLQLCLLLDQSRSTEVRLHTLNILHEAGDRNSALNDDQASDFLVEIAGVLIYETNPVIFDALADVALRTATWTISPDVFDAILKVLKLTLFELASRSPVTSPSLQPGYAPRLGDQPLSLGSPSATIGKIFVKLFLRSVQRCSWKSQKLYLVLREIAGSTADPADARIIALKLLVRIRSDINHAIFIAVSTESEDLAENLCRTDPSFASYQKLPESPVSRPLRTDDTSAKRKAQSSPTTATQPFRSIPSAIKSPSTIGRISRPNPPLWQYPGPKGLPEDPPASASRVLFATRTSAPTRDGIFKVGEWLELALSLLQRDDLEWETYSYLIVHLGTQLTNHSLFADAIPQIQLLRSVLCNQLQSKSFHDPPGFTNLKKSDIAVCLYHILAVLISYRQHFARGELDEMVKVFVLGVGSREKTSEGCIHALAVCCHEVPTSIVKLLDQVLKKMSQIITQSATAVHVLEFLAGLARSPELFKNFREDDYKVVFGVCFRYLQYVRDQKPKPMQLANARSVKGSLPSTRDSREALSMSEDEATSRTIAEALPQYVYALAYHVMTFWFISSKLQDRPRQMAWIIQNLYYADESGNLVLEEQGEVLIDLMNRMAFSDRDDTAADPNFATAADGPLSKKSWLVGMSILTVETAGRSGLSQITRRRPSGTRHSIFKPTLVQPQRHQVPLSIGLAAESYYTPSYVGILPEDIVQEYYSPLSVSEPQTMGDFPIPLSEDDATQRAMSAFDRTSALDGHKVGILYVGEGQTTETEILANVMGSADYISFLQGIGTLMELKNATFNAQGLDREFETDGKFAFCWRDRVTELIFHVATMMPTELARDPQCANKKKHLGNDFVNIVFNNSGAPFLMDTFPSDFNYVNIVITPEARTSFVDTRLRAADHEHSVGGYDQPTQGYSYYDTESVDQAATPAASSDHRAPYAHSLFYKVKVLTKPGLPKISPAVETKTISGASLPAYVRLLALNASVFSLVWSHRHGGEHISSWRSRLQEIKRLRDRHSRSSVAPRPTDMAVSPVLTATSGASVSHSSPNPPGGHSASTSHTTSGSLRESILSLRRPSTFMPGVETERSSSAGSHDP